MSWPSRAFLVLIGVVAFAAVMSGAACTRKGSNTPAPPTPTPIETYYVNPLTGNDTSGNGSPASPFKTLTKAIKVVASSTTSNLTIVLAPGHYHGGPTGEKFPIVFPTGMTVTGSNYAAGEAGGSYIDGYGEDTALEKLTGKAAKTLFTTLEIDPGESVTLSGIYAGTTTSPPSTASDYAAIDVLGSLSASLSTFAVAPGLASPKINGVVVPGGSLTCSSCVIQGNSFGAQAFSVGGSGSSSSAGTASLNLSQGPNGKSVITGKHAADILGDGTANLTVSGSVFGQSPYGYTDLGARGASSSSAAGTIDFGGGPNGSSGLNTLIGAAKAELYVTLPNQTIYAFGNTWNPNQQSSDKQGRYPVRMTFTPSPSVTGPNVRFGSKATGSAVHVGPLPLPTPTTSPSASPSAPSSPIPSPT